MAFELTEPHTQIPNKVTKMHPRFQYPNAPFIFSTFCPNIPYIVILGFCAFYIFLIWFFFQMMVMNSREFVDYPSSVLLTRHRNQQNRWGILSQQISSVIRHKWNSCFRNIIQGDLFIYFIEFNNKVGCVRACLRVHPRCANAS